MIRVRLGDATLNRTRIAISPLNEAVAALELLHREPGRVSWPYTRWAAKARQVLAVTPATAPLRLYGDLYGTHHGRRTPDLFEPPPSSPAPRLAEELALLRHTPAGLVREQFSRNYPEGTPAFLEPYAQDPGRALAALADGLEAFWELAIAPYWPAIRRALDEEVLLRARSLAARGPDALLADLGGKVRWEPPVLLLSRQAESVLETEDQRLVLVPMIFADNRVTVSTDDPELLKLSFQARGAGVLAGPARPSPGAGDDDRLAPLLGPRRAAVLRALAQPATTTSLAVMLGLAPSTVSEQLAALLAAGAVNRRRSGRHVVYSLEPTGAAMLSLFGPESAAQATAS